MTCDSQTLENSRLSADPSGSRAASVKTPHRPHRPHPLSQHAAHDTEVFLHCLASVHAQTPPPIALTHDALNWTWPPTV